MLGGVWKCGGGDVYFRLMLGAKNKVIERGRNKFWRIFGVMMTISVVVALKQLSVGQYGGADFIRFLLTLLIFYYLYRGNRVARVILEILLVLGGIFSLLSAVSLLNISLFGVMILLIIGGLYLFMAFYLERSKDLRAFFESQKKNK